MLLEFLVLVHVREVEEAVLDLVSVLVRGLEINRSRLVRIYLEVDLLLLVLTFIFEHLFHDELRIIFIQVRVLVARATRGGLSCPRMVALMLRLLLRARSRRGCDTLRRPRRCNRD